MKLGGRELADFAVICTDESESVRTAAEELKRYVKKVCGTELSSGNGKDCAICLGPNVEIAAGEIGKLKSEDGFVLKMYGKNFVISGKSAAAVLYGTYYFIEKYLGVEWLTPDCEIATPKGKDESVNPDEIYDFTAMMRVCHSFFAYDERYRARHRLTFTVGDINDIPAYGGLRGLKFAFYWGYFGHTFEVLLPYETYYEKHPEWYSFAKTYAGENHRYQICLTNPDVLKIVTENALAYLDAHPDCRVISISQNDSYGDFAENYCKCEQCSALWKKDGNYSAVILNFVNAVAREIKKKYPDVWVHTFAYHFSEDPPRTVVPDDNVLVQFCLHLPYGASITDGSERSERERSKAEGWRKLTKHLFAWTYICDHGNYLAPVGNFRSLYENTSYFLQGRVIGLFQQERMDFYNCEFSEMRTYLTAKLFSDPYMSYEQYLELAERFLTGYFGKGGKYILQYLYLLDEKYKDADTVRMNEEEKLHFFGDGKFIAEGEKLYDAAERLAETEEQKKRLARCRMQLTFCKCAKAYLENDPAYPEMHRQFVQGLVDAGVGKYREGACIPPVGKLDYTKNPLIFSQIDKEIRLSEKACERERAGESTAPLYGFDFAFTAAYRNETLFVKLDVTDGEIFTRDNHIESWEQDCAEFYISESCNRGTSLKEGDYKIRVNAHGIANDFGCGKIRKCTAKATSSGYTIELELNLTGRKKIGFEITVHDFAQDGSYKSTRYWNALKNADVFNAPYHYGILILEE